MTRFVAGVLLCFAGSFCFMACGAPPEEEPVGSVAEPMVLLKPPKHFSGEPEYPVEGPPKLDLPPPWLDDPSDPGPEQEPFEPPTYEPPEPDHHNGIDPYEHANPHHESTGNHGGPHVGGSGESTHTPPKLGTVKCSNPADCVQKCEAKGITCPAAHAIHPYKRDNVCISGWLVTCKSYPIDPSQECHYRYPNGDYCKFFYYPSKPAMCIYQGGQGGQDYPH
jgi:hypothetical protein